MSIAEKLTTITSRLTEINDSINTEAELISELQNVVDNIPDSEGKIFEQAYSEGYENGKADEYDRLIDESKIIKGEVIGSSIVVNDVSEIPHKCTVSVDKDANVTVCGKNLVNLDSVTFNSRYWRREEDIFVSDNNTAATPVYVQIPLKAGVTYRFSAHIKPNASGRYSLTVRDGDNKILASHYPTAEGTYSISYTPSESSVYRFTAGGTNNDSGMTISQLQIEIGASETDYEPYNGSTHPLTAGQTIEVDSICPTMTLFADNDATITFGYHQSWGITQTKQAEYDRLWDMIQGDGGPRNYQYSFCNWWTQEYFKPKYDFIPTNLIVAFNGFGLNDKNSLSFDMAEYFERKGLIFDTSQCTYFSSTFNYANIGRLPAIDLRAAKDKIATAFAYGKITTIDKLIVDEGNVFTNTFLNQKGLTNITFEGVIASNISFAQSNLLTEASVQSIIDHLKDLTEATAQTLTFHADVGAKLTDEQKATITTKNWTLVY